jgi:hypothetical protein
MTREEADDVDAFATAVDGDACIGSPIDDRQYSLVQSFGSPGPAMACRQRSAPRARSSS